jgi:hypothetical protein
MRDGNPVFSHRLRGRGAVERSGGRHLKAHQRGTSTTRHPSGQEGPSTTARRSAIERRPATCQARKSCQPLSTLRAPDCRSVCGPEMPIDGVTTPNSTDASVPLLSPHRATSSTRRFEGETLASTFTTPTAGRSHTRCARSRAIDLSRHRSPKHDEHVGPCADRSSLSWLALKSDAALVGIRKTVARVIADERQPGSDDPGCWRKGRALQPAAVPRGRELEWNASVEESGREGSMSRNGVRQPGTPAPQEAMWVLALSIDHMRRGQQALRTGPGSR